MKLIRIFEKGGDDYREYKKAVKMAKKAIDTICDLTEDMEEQYGYGERGSVRYKKSHDYDDYEVDERGGYR